MDQRFKFETRLLFAFVIAVLAIAALAASSWHAAREAQEAALLVARTHEVSGHLADAKAESLLAELNTQNYRLTGNAEHLASRDAAIAARELSLRRLGELTADNPRQQERWLRLRATADERMAISRRTELLRRTEGAAAAQAYVAGAPVRETRERLFATLREMDDEADRLLRERESEQSRVREIRNALGALTVLAQAGHEVLTAEGGEAGVAAALAHAPDLVLMDVQMPGVDGLEALRRLRADPRGASLKVAALTALAMKGDAERLLAEGFAGYLEKPIRYKEFLASVAALLGGTSE